jgi:pimeloyl-ACP methyl ester carboxylesterase
MRQQTEVVLVHGLWHQPAHFDRLAATLRGHGVTVHIPRLHRGSLAADTAAVQEVVDACRMAPVPLGHSYGGSVITGLERVRHLIYVAAFVPAAGESGTLLGGADALVNKAVQHNDDGTTSIDPGQAREVLYADCSEADSAWATGCSCRNNKGTAAGCRAALPGKASRAPTSSAKRTKHWTLGFRSACPAGAPERLTSCRATHPSLVSRCNSQRSSWAFEPSWMRVRFRLTVSAAPARAATS